MSNSSGKNINRDGERNLIYIFLRFEKNDLFCLHKALAIPEKYVCSQGTTAAGMEALMILLRRLAYPNRLSDLVQLFGRRKSELSLMFSKVRS